MTTKLPDRVRQYLRRRGCPHGIVQGGLDGLMSHWESLVEAVDEGYDLTFEDYLNDMDLRDILGGALEVTTPDDRAAAEQVIEELDRRFLSLTVECSPIWGEKTARENEHDPAVQWWYFRRPKRPAPDFEEELREAGIV